MPVEVLEGTLKTSGSKVINGGRKHDGGIGSSRKIEDNAPSGLYITLLALTFALVIGALVYGRKRNT